MFKRLKEKLASLKEGFNNLSRPKKIVVVGITILILVGLVFLAVLTYGFLQPPATVSTEAKNAPTSTKEQKNVANPLNGILYTKSEARVWQERVPLAVIIENLASKDVRPQSGLSKADVVYEALAESEITRLMGIYLSNSTELGPVRSLREYYLDWLMEVGAGVAFWNSNQCVKKTAASLLGAKNLDQAEGGASAYWRVSDRPNPHNGYSSTDKLWELAKSRGVNSLPTIESWQFKEEASASARPAAGKVNVNFTGANSYSVEWAYDAAANDYKRSNGGAPHTDKINGEQLKTKNVVVEFVKGGAMSYNCGPGVNNRVFEIVGEGRVLIFRDGQALEGTWKKPSRAGRTKFFDKEGKEIALNRGPIWVEVVPVGAGVSYQ